MITEAKEFLEKFIHAELEAWKEEAKLHRFTLPDLQKHSGIKL
jgi:hypothetical protein